MSNFHRDLNDANKHTAKGFTSGLAGSACIRNENGAQEFEKPYGFPASINFVDGNAAPPTTVDGDIYVLEDRGNGALHPDWELVPIVTYGDWVKKSTVWLPRKPQAGTICFNKADSTNYYFDGTDWNSIGSSLGRVAIYDSSGIPTFYATLDLANAAASENDTFHLFSNITVTSTVFIYKNINIQGNGFSITNSTDDATHTIEINKVGVFDAKWSNLQIIRTGRTNGSSGYALWKSTGGTCNLDGNGVIVTNTYGEAGYFASNLGLISGFKFYGYTYGCTTATSMRDIYAMGQTSVGYYQIQRIGENITGESISGDGLLNIGGERIDNSVGRSITGTAIGSTFGIGNGPYYNCIGQSSTGFASFVAYSYNSIFNSNGNVALRSSTAYNVYAESVDSQASVWSTINGGFISSINNFTLRPNDASSSYYNVTILCRWNNINGHCVDNVDNLNGAKFIGCNFIVTNASANCIKTGSLAIANCTYTGATTPLSGVTNLVINTSDSQGNILI